MKSLEKHKSENFSQLLYTDGTMKNLINISDRQSHRTRPSHNAFCFDDINDTGGGGGPI